MGHAGMLIGLNDQIISRCCVKDSFLGVSISFYSYQIILMSLVLYFGVDHRVICLMYLFCALNAVVS